MANSQRTEQEIFLAALECEQPEQRESWIREVCGNDEGLRRRIEELIAAHTHAENPFDLAPVVRPASSLVIVGDTDDWSGERVGSYQLLRKLGEGGMGVVYLAQQLEPIVRQVALKLVRAGMSSQQVVARFDAERQALALMDHPNIARVLDAGTATRAGQSWGVPYFVMELVDGIPITQYCDEQRLTPRERFELFETVCRAVHHAHQKGIVHRDLKPSNILVALCDGRPVAKIIDFGVAKALDRRLTSKTLFTEFGHVIGTLEYMSPEQARLDHWDIDTRSDVYSLGVLLYELLVGETPFDRKRLELTAFDDMLRIIREEEPPVPSRRLSDSHSLEQVAANRRLEPKRLNSVIRGEPDWIVMKALDKDRTRRYDSAGSLADDIHRYLNREPVQACPPSAWYLTRKLASRYRTPLVAITLVILSLAVGLMMATQQAAIARRETRESDRQRRRVTAALQQTETARRSADRAVIELHEAQGCLHSDRFEYSDAALWFAHAAAYAEGRDSASRDTNLRRASAFVRVGPRPLRAFMQPKRFFYALQLRFHPTGKYLVCFVADPGGENRSLVSDPDLWSLWDIDREKMMTLPLKMEDVRSIDWTSDGETIAIASQDSDLIVARFPTFENLIRMPDSRGARCVAFSADGQHLSAAFGRQVRIWSVTQGKWLEGTLDHPQDVRYAKWNPHASQLMTVCGLEARVFAVPSVDGQPLFPAVRHVVGRNTVDRSAVWPLFADCGQLLVTVDTHVRWREIATGREWGSSRIARGAFSYAGEIQPEADSLSTMNLTWDDKMVKIAELSADVGRVEYIQLEKDAHDRESGKVFFQSVPGITSLEHSPGGIFLLTGSQRGPVQLDSNYDTRSIRHTNAVTSVAFSSDGRLFATVQRDGLIRVWDTLSAFMAYDLLPTSAITLVTLSGDGRFVAPSGITHSQEEKSRHFMVYDSETAMPMVDLPIDAGGEMAAAVFSHNGERFAVATESPNALTIWDWRQGKPALSPIDLPAGPRGINWHQGEPGELGGRIAVLCENAELLMINASNGKIESRWTTLPMGNEGYPVNNGSVVFSADGKTIITYGYSCEVWDAATGKRRFPAIEHGGRCYDVAISPDGKVLATAGFDSTARTWNLETGQPIGPILEHPSWLFTIGFSPDGQCLVTGGQDQLVRLWNWSDGTWKCAPMTHASMVVDVAYTPDGKSVVTLDSQNRWCLWDPNTGRPLIPFVLQRERAGARQIIVRSDGKRLILSGRPITLIDLTAMPQPITSVDEVVRQAELTSGQTLRSGTVNNLSSSQWMERWSRAPKRPPLPSNSDRAISGIQD